jgi:hypothetical protein
MTDAERRRVWLEGALAGWKQSGEGWNDEIAYDRPDKMPDFEELNPYPEAGAL